MSEEEQMDKERFVLRIPLDPHTADTAEKIADLLRDIYRLGCAPGGWEIGSIFDLLGLEVEVVKE